MIIIHVLILLFFALLIEAAWRLVLAALLWMPIVCCAVAAAQFTATLHLADPLAPLWGFLAGGLIARAALKFVLTCLVGRV